MGPVLNAINGLEPPIDLASKRLLDFFMFTKGKSEKGVATADLTNRYLHAACKQELYLEIPLSIAP